MRITGRRGFVIGAALVTVTAVTATSTACQRPQRAEVKLPSESVVSLKFADLPDGPAPTTVSGVPARVSPEVVPDDPGAKFRIVNGKLTVEPTKARQGASYFNVQLGAPVVNIGARWVYNPRGGTKDGAMALLVSREAVKPPFPVHFTATPYKWAYGVWPPVEGGNIPQLENLEEGEFNPPLKEDGTTVYEAQVTLDGDRALISLPDGQRRTIRDKRIAEWVGGYATFEAWARNGVTDAAVAFTEIWARRKIG